VRSAVTISKHHQSSSSREVDMSERSLTSTLSLVWLNLAFVWVSACIQFRRKLPQEALKKNNRPSRSRASSLPTKQGHSNRTEFLGDILLMTRIIESALNQAIIIFFADLLMKPVSKPLLTPQTCRHSPPELCAPSETHT
jgi:hypothetical protein